MDPRLRELVADLERRLAGRDPPAAPLPEADREALARLGLEALKAACAEGRAAETAGGDWIAAPSLGNAEVTPPPPAPEPLARPLAWLSAAVDLVLGVAYVLCAGVGAAAALRWLILQGWGQP